MEKVDAEVIEDKQLEKFHAISLEPAKITADYEGMQKALDKILEDYKGMDVSKLVKAPNKDLKTARANLNRVIKNVEDARKTIKKSYNEPLKDFEDHIKAILEPVK